MLNYQRVFAFGHEGQKLRPKISIIAKHAICKIACSSYMSYFESSAIIHTTCYMIKICWFLEFCVKHGYISYGVASHSNPQISLRRQVQILQCPNPIPESLVLFGQNNPITFVLKIMKSILQPIQIKSKSIPNHPIISILLILIPIPSQDIDASSPPKKTETSIPTSVPSLFQVTFNHNHYIINIHKLCIYIYSIYIHII